MKQDQGHSMLGRLFGAGRKSGAKEQAAPLTGASLEQAYRDLLPRGRFPIGVLFVEVPPETLDETLRIATSLLVRERLGRSGDAFAMVLGWPTSGRTNTVKLHRL